LGWLLGHVASIRLPARKVKLYSWSNSLANPWRLDLPDGHPQNQDVRLLFLLLGEKVRMRAVVK